MHVESSPAVGTARALQTRLHEILKHNPQGISEFELLQQLQQQQDSGFDPAMLRDDLAMFRGHFLLFHALYRLRDELVRDQLGLLDIHVLCIRLLPFAAGETDALAHSDPLRAYYLDLNNLEDTTLDDVETLLGQFWARYLASEKRVDSLHTLGLDASASHGEIEYRYRQLAMQLHPDRGGDAQQFQRLQEAITVLRRCG